MQNNKIQNLGDSLTFNKVRFIYCTILLKHGSDTNSKTLPGKHNTNRGYLIHKHNPQQKSKLELPLIIN